MSSFKSSKTEPSGQPVANTHDTARAIGISATMSERLRAQLGGFGVIEWVDSTPSTNQDLILRVREASFDQAPLPWLRGARLQTAGKGRAGRPWQNASDATLMFSCAFAPEIPLARLPGLSPALGVAACEALRGLVTEQVTAYAARGLGLKWPNDLQWTWQQDDNRLRRGTSGSVTESDFTTGKLAGILVETAPCTAFKHPVIVAGIGLNLRGGQALTAELGRPIADWTMVTGSYSQVAKAGISAQTPEQTSTQISTQTSTPISTQSAVAIVTAIARSWQQAIATYAAEGFAAFMQRYDQVDDLRQVQVNLIDQNKVLSSGIASGVDQTGRLLIQTADGEIPVMTGDVSVRRV